MSYAYHMLGNVEKERLVIDLYYNQRKNVRQIAQEARISFRDIAAILKKEAAANHGSGNGNEDGIIVVDNQQERLQQDDLTTSDILLLTHSHVYRTSMASLHLRKF
jgi:hypothetical protein